MQLNNKKFCQGNEAVVLGAIYAGIDFFAGYPITPSTEILEHLSMRMPMMGKKCIQMTDEFEAIGSILGASLVGKKVMTATSGPGFSLMLESLKYAVSAEIPCVVVNVQRIGPSEGSPTLFSQSDYCQAKIGIGGDYSLIILTASNNQDLFKMTVDAFNFAEMYRTPVVLLIDEVSAHTRENLFVPDIGELPVTTRSKVSPKIGEEYYPYLLRENGSLPTLDFGGKYRYNITEYLQNNNLFDPDDTKFIKSSALNREAKIKNISDEIQRYKLYWNEDADIILISYGSSARSAIHLAKNRRARGHKYGVLELQTLSPFPKDIVREICGSSKYVFVVEQNKGQLIQDVKLAVQNPKNLYLANRMDGELITPDDIGSFIEIALGKGG